MCPRQKWAPVTITLTEDLRNFSTADSQKQAHFDYTGTADHKIIFSFSTVLHCCDVILALASLIYVCRFRSYQL